MIRATAAVCLAVFLSGRSTGQDATPAAFEVASVKPNKSGGGRGGVRTDPERVTGTNATLRQLILFAYDLRGYQLSAPSWIESDRYDVTGKAEMPASADQPRGMLRTLLTDRFRLKTHRETKELPVYGLVIAKSGPKLHDVKEVESLAKSGPPPALKPGVNGMFMTADLPQFAERLSGPLGRPVLDKTGLKGVYRFQLEWGLDPLQSPSASGGDRSELPPDSAGSLFAVLQEQCGLKLEAGRAPIDTLVVDHVERASENR